MALFVNLCPVAAKGIPGPKGRVPLFRTMHATTTIVTTDSGASKLCNNTRTPQSTLSTAMIVTTDSGASKLCNNTRTPQSTALFQSFRSTLPPQNKSYLIDIYTLGPKAFDTTGKLDHTLRSLLQSELVPKVFFDVRNDSDALFSHFEILLAGVVDSQVMEYATRNFRSRYVCGLSQCIERDLDLPYRQRSECQQVKEEGLTLFAPERAGSYEVLNKRPLSDAIGLYCAQDVRWLPELYQVYLRRKISEAMSVKIARTTLNRVKESQSPSYVGHGKQKALGPW